MPWELAAYRKVKSAKKGGNFFDRNDLSKDAKTNYLLFKMASTSSQSALSQKVIFYFKLVLFLNLLYLHLTDRLTKTLPHLRCGAQHQTLHPCLARFSHGSWPPTKRSRTPKRRNKNVAVLLKWNGSYS
jgi:hypothetical protein